MLNLLHADERFATSNTNLAACLGALRIPIKQTDPVSVVEDGETGKRVVTFYFEERGDKHEAKKVKWGWDHREEFEKRNPNHALTDMRNGLDHLAWLTRVWHGNITPSVRAGVSNYETDDANLSACFMVAGHALHSFGKPHYRFSTTETERERILEEFECFRRGDSPIANARRAIECRRLLLDLVKRAPHLLHYTHGDPFTGGKDGYIAAGASEDELNKFFHTLYA